MLDAHLSMGGSSVPCPERTRAATGARESTAGTHAGRVSSLLLLAVAAACAAEPPQPSSSPTLVDTTEPQAVWIPVQPRPRVYLSPRVLLPSPRVLLPTVGVTRPYGHEGAASLDPSWWLPPAPSQDKPTAATLGTHPRYVTHHGDGIPGGGSDDVRCDPGPTHQASEPQIQPRVHLLPTPRSGQGVNSPGSQAGFSEAAHRCDASSFVTNRRITGWRKP